MRNDLLVIFTIFIILIIIVLFTIIYFIPPNQQFTSPEGTFLSPCTTNGTCSSNGLTCDNTSNLCKLAANQPCSHGSDCAGNFFCSGLCVPNGSPVGGIGQFCPCNAGNICVPGGTSGSVCKGGVDVSCTNDSQCASNFCASASGAITPCGPLDLNCVCRAGLPLAAACMVNSDCETNNCSLGFCQSLNIVTGTKGAYCAAGSTCPNYAGASCNNGLQCLCTTLTDGSAIGVCTSSDNGLLSPCSASSGCPNPMACTTYGSNTNNNTCLYTNNTCITGTTLMGSACKNNTNIGCTIDNNCASGSCNNNGTLSVYTFNNSVTTTFALTQTATLLGIDQTSGSPSVFQPYKIFAISNGTIDNIYLVDLNAGLLVTRINTTTLTVTQPWTILQDHFIMGLGTLVDAIVDQNENQYLVYNNGTNDIVYTYNGINYIPFNGGIQYDTAMNVLTIEYIDISLNNDILIGSSGGTIYTKAFSTALYTLQTSTYTGGSPLFFFPAGNTPSDESFAYLNSGIVNFSSEVPIFCMDTSGMITNFNVNPTNSTTFIYFSDLVGVQNTNLFAQLPGNFSSSSMTSKSLVTNNGYYMLTPASCN